MPDFFTDGNTPNRTDTKWRIQQKILGAVIAGGGSTFNNLSGTGSPVGVETPDYVGQTYTDLNGGFWTAIGATNADWQQIV